jgi:hypothetical protein
MGSLSHQVTALPSQCTYVLIISTNTHLVHASYACRSGFLPPYRGDRYHLTEYGNRNHPTNARELFKLRHSSLRVTVERAFGALKNRFRILDNKPFHPYMTHVKLVLACCILHNWILGFGIDQVVPAKGGFTSTQPDPLDTLPLNENQSQESNDMTLRRDAIYNAMWEGRGTSRI